MKNKDLDFETKAIHVGQDPDPVTGAVIPPIYIQPLLMLRKVQANTKDMITLEHPIQPVMLSRFA